MQAQTLLTTGHDVRQDEPRARAQGPQPLDLRDLERVAGGLPRGGWGSAENAELLDAVQLPRGGW
jgi:hypothetical protein